jgi:hypothetical protein
MTLAAGSVPSQPFQTPEDAWFWTIGCLLARREGSSSGGRGTLPRPCEPDDVVLCLDRLYRERKIDLSHARVLRCWGERQMPPQRESAGCPGREHRLWRDAMACLEPLLKQKGIVSENSIYKKSVLDLHTNA